MSESMVIGLLGGAIVAAFAVIMAALAAYACAVIVMEIRNMWRDDR